MSMTVPYTLDDAGYDAVDCAPCDDTPWIHDIVYDNWDHAHDDRTADLALLMGVCWRTIEGLSG